MATPEQPPVGDKASLRRLLREARRQRPQAERDSAGEAIARAALGWAPVREAPVVAAYASIGTEPPTWPLLDALVAAGVRVLLPVTRPDLDLDWAVYVREHDMVRAVHGTLEARGARLGVDAVRTARVVIAPGTAVSVDGTRLGQGGGCYDRALARVDPLTPVAVVLYDDEVGLDVPTEPHDRRVTHALTPSGVRALG